MDYLSVENETETENENGLGRMYKLNKFISWCQDLENRVRLENSVEDCWWC